jgi:hypothetical protein
MRGPTERLWAPSGVVVISDQISPRLERPRKPDPRSILTIDLREEHEFAALIEAGASTAEGPREQQEGLVGLSLEHGAQD